MSRFAIPPTALQTAAALPERSPVSHVHPVVGIYLLSNGELIASDIVKDWSNEYITNTERRFAKLPTVSLKTWTESYQWAKLSKQVPLKNSTELVCSYRIPAELDLECKNFEKPWETFDEYKEQHFREWEVIMPREKENWLQGTCNCPKFLKDYICKHLVGLAIRLKHVQPPSEARTIPIGMKRKEDDQPKPKSVNCAAERASSPRVADRLRSLISVSIEKCRLRHVQSQCNPQLHNLKGLTYGSGGFRLSRNDKLPEFVSKCSIFCQGGRVRKKSSKLMDFESPDDIEARFKKQTSAKGFPNLKPPDSDKTCTENSPKQEEDGESGSESDFFDNNAEMPDSVESDSSGSEEGSTRTPANSLYMMEKSSKKKLIVKDGRVVGRAKAQRKDKGKTRITAYLLWAKDARNDLIKKHPDMDFAAISKRLGEMWANVTYNERYMLRRKAKRLSMKKGQPPLQTPMKTITNTVRHGGTSAGSRTPVKTTATNVTGVQTVVVTSGGGANVPSAFRVSGCGVLDISAHMRLLGESLTIIGERLKEHEGQIAVSGSVSVLLDTLLCSLTPLVCVTTIIPEIAPPAEVLQDTLHNIAYIMPGL
ncbi:HMG box-containing protein 4 [Eumeta japonica]|uniref:HMG box-containing protein 4 n=1 Tax=Eumeta variegata TaxID=151549 RepID=A0A4C1VW52_EUMVA|nr:HMG box-containing protein 4 [Eumeta japonica]